MKQYKALFWIILVLAAVTGGSLYIALEDNEVSGPDQSEESAPDN